MTINPSQIGKRQLHFIRLDHVLFNLNKLSKDTAFMFTFTPFSSVKLAASNVEYCFSICFFNVKRNKLQYLNHFVCIGKKH